MMNVTELYALFQAHPHISTDSRNPQPGAIFFAMKGANFNGNAYAAQALQQGCAWAVVDEAQYANNERVLLVDNCLQTLQELARLHRQTLGTRIIGITGTNGKTTTKELISTVLQRRYRVLYTQGNFNNHLGVPLTLLRLTREHELAVVEMGANHPGEIAALVQIAQPDFGLITNVGRAHLEGFGSLEGVKKTKGELYDYLRTHGGKIFLHADNPQLCAMAQERGLEGICYGTDEHNYVSGQVIDVTPYLHLQFRADGAPLPLPTHLIGDYNLSNVLSAVCVGRYFGVSNADIQAAIAAYTPTNNRSQLIETDCNTLVVDAYNANPTSMEASLRSFARLPAAQKALFLGDMLELGGESIEEHQKIVDLAQTLGFREVYLFGRNFAHTRNNFVCLPDVAAFTAYKKSHPVQGRTCLIKGSHSMQMDHLKALL